MEHTSRELHTQTAAAEPAPFDPGKSPTAGVPPRPGQQQPFTTIVWYDRGLSARKYKWPVYLCFVLVLLFFPSCFLLLYISFQFLFSI